MMITGINHITFSVSQLDRSVNFYQHTLGFKCEVIWESGAYLSATGIWLCLSKGTPKPSEDYSHIAFSVSRERFKEYTDGIVASGATIWKHNKSEGESLYFLDPDGHKLEIHLGGLHERLKSLETVPYKGLNSM